MLLGYEIPLRRIGAGLFPANENFQPSPFSGTSEADNAHSFGGAKAVYFETGLDKLVDATRRRARGQDPRRVRGSGSRRRRDGRAATSASLLLASGSPERATAEAAVRALTDLARDLRQAGNRLGILVVVPGM